MHTTSQMRSPAERAAGGLAAGAFFGTAGLAGLAGSAECGEPAAPRPRVDRRSHPPLRRG